jgi:hypothetical protein
MAGRFNRKTRAAIAHNKVVEPKTGNIPSATPKAILREILSELIPSPRSVFVSLNNFALIEVIIFKTYIFA